MAKKINGYTSQVQSGILLNANESTANLPADIIKEIQEMIPSVAFNRYPDNDETEIRNAYGRAMHLSPECILAGNGSDQMLGLLIGTFLGKGKTLYTFDPDFSMYDYYASAYEADAKKYELNPDGTLDLPSFIEEGKKAGVNLVMFSNPNNPSGNCLSIEKIRQILDGFAGIPVVVDEAYMEFSDEESALDLIDAYDNLYVTRTMSKAYSLAGIRLGFLVSAKKNMDRIRPGAVPYALNTLTMKTGCIVLRHVDEFRAEAEETKRKRKAMYEKVSKLKSVYFWNSQANFLHGRCDHKEELLKMFAQKNIVIRNYAGRDTFRITIGSDEENAMVLDVLQKYEEKYACEKLK